MSSRIETSTLKISASAILFSPSVSPASRYELRVTCSTITCPHIDVIRLPRCERHINVRKWNAPECTRSDRTETAIDRPACAPTSRLCSLWRHRGKVVRGRRDYKVLPL